MKATGNAARRAALLGLLAALALVFGYAETVLLPFNFGLPGIKLGLANLVVVTALYTLSAPAALAVSGVKIILGGLLFGSFAGLLYSLSGGLVSLAVMVLLKRSGKFGLLGVSAAGGVAHNIGQLGVACAVLGTARLGFLLPALLISGIVTGLAIGAAATLCIPLIEKVSRK